MRKQKISLFTLATLLLINTLTLSADWPDKVKLKGDLRFRHEYTDQEGKLERNRQRIRARIGIDAKLDNGVRLGFRLASGSDEPISTNQTLGGGFSTKSIGIDQAFFEWKPENANGVTVTGGKIKNPLYKPGKTEMIWDGDLNPEGLALSYKSAEGKTQYFVTVAGFWINESSSGADAGLRAVQGGLQFDLADGKSVVTFGAGFYDYSNLEGASTVYDPTKSFGNSVDGAGVYMYDYNLLELFADVSFKADGTPLSLFGDFVTNSGPDTGNTGWLVGATFGRAKETGSWEGRINYRNVEPDAVLGAFTDSDFRGGGTDGKGFEFGVNVAAASKVKLGASLFIDKQSLVTENNFTRLQLDANFEI